MQTSRRLDVSGVPATSERPAAVGPVHDREPQVKTHDSWRSDGAAITAIDTVHLDG